MKRRGCDRTVPARRSAGACGRVLASCSSPNPKLYVLAMVPGKTHHGAPAVIELRAIAIAHYLERSQIVRSSEGYRLDVLSNEWWGEPLDSMMGRILVQELNQRLPGSTVYSDSGAISTPADATVEINLQRFDLDRDGDVLLAAQIAVEGKRSASRAVALKAAARGCNHPGAGRGHEHCGGSTRRYDRRDAGRHCCL